jgi:hypothetical protein
MIRFMSIKKARILELYISKILAFRKVSSNFGE